LTGGALGLSALSYYFGVTKRFAPAPADSLPAYADAGVGFPVFRAPYLQKDARLAAFLFSADLHRVSALCDQVLNVSESFAYRYIPLTSSVMLVFADMLVSSRDERDALVGFIPETEVSFWVLTVAMQKTQSGVVPHHLAWFLPYLFVDEGNAIATGREVFGFNKQLAQFQKPDEIRRPEFAANVLGFQQFSADAVAKTERLLELKGASSAVSQNDDVVKKQIGDGLMKSARTDLGGGLVEFAARFINDRIPLVFLKQFRDAQDSRKACYQKIIEAPLQVETFHEGGVFLDSYALNIAPLASHPLAQNLGLQLEQKSMLGAWMKVDFVLGNGLAM